MTDLHTLEPGSLSYIETQIVAPNVCSLQWTREGLADWASGGTLYTLEGETRSGGRAIYRFDAALVSPSGRFSVAYERLGTKGVIFEGSRIIREIDRSFYHANQYEFPVALSVLPDGDEAIIHCPKDYNRLEIERLSTGERLSRSDSRATQDIFHSRLRVNASGTLLADACWFWHPWCHVNVYDLVQALEQPQKLDEHDSLPFGIEFNDAMFFGDALMITTPSIPEDDQEPLELSTPNTVGVFDVASRGWRSIHRLEKPIGPFFPLSLRYIVSFYEYPKVVDLYT